MNISEKIAFYVLRREAKFSELQILILMFIGKVRVSNEAEIRGLFNIHKQTFEGCLTLFREHKLVRKRGATNIYLTKTGREYLEDLKIRLQMLVNQQGKLEADGIYRYTYD